VTKLIPCLAEHKGNGDQPEEVVLVSNMKNQHVLDDFIFSLFQMYAQVYLHPKIVGLEDIIRSLIKERTSSQSGMTITFDLHKSLTDEKFRDLLEVELCQQHLHLQ
jgi:HD superfamily phosphohydrolase